MKRVVWLLGLLFLIGQHVSSQLINLTGEYKTVDYISPSPEAASLLAAGKSGVSLATGALNVNLPLYTFSLAGYTLPVSLSYTTKGVRVDDISSTAGMGWVLQTAGVVTRTVMDMPDENRITYAPNNFNAPSLDSVSSMSLFNYLKDDEITDTESDIFQFSAGGLSGSFYLDSTLTPVLMSKHQIKISRLPGDSLYEFNGFEITDDRGVRYSFTVVESSRKYNTGGSECKNAWGVDVVSPVPTAWHLSKIRINSHDSIMFYYNAVFEKFQSGISQRVAKVIESSWVRGCPSSGGPSGTFALVGSETFSQCLAWQENTVQRISRIECSDGSKAQFSYTFDRLDLGTPGLSMVKILNGKNETIKRYEFQLETVESNNTTGIPVNTGALARYETNKYRTFLKRMDEVDVNDTLKKNSYYFFYNDPVSLPPRLSYAQDHWGYFNGANNDLFFGNVPEHPFNPLFNGEVPGISTTIWTRNRNPSQQHMYKGTLSKIVYPTGGHEEFNYTSATEKGYTNIPQDTTATISRFNLDFTDTPVKDTVYIPFPQAVAINSSCTRNVADPDFHGGCTYQMFPLDTNKVSGIGYSTTIENPNISETIFVDSGYYVISTYTTAVWDSTLAIMSLTYQNEEPVKTEVEKLLGGVVVASVKKFTHEGGLAGETQYEYGSAADSVSNVRKLVDVPSYFSTAQEWRFESCIGPGGEIVNISCVPALVHKSVVLNSSIIDPLSATGAAPYYFNSVKEYQTSSSGVRNGMILHKFLFADVFSFIAQPFVKYGDQIRGTSFGYCPEYSLGEYETEVYSGSVANNNLTLLKRTTSYHSAEMLPAVTNQVINSKYENPCAQSTYPFFIDGFDVNLYKLQGMHVRVDSVYEQSFESNGAMSLLTKILYENPAYSYPTKKIAINSNGNLVSQAFVYPADVVGSGYNASGIITKMLATNYTSAVIESIETANNVQKAKTVTKYKEFPAGTNDIVTDTVIRYASHATIPQERVYFPSYNNNGNALTVSKQDNIDVAYVWGYHYQYPVAKIVGKSFANAISSTGLDTALLNNLTMTDAQMRTELNKLRNLTGCFVTTYTYKPLVGMTSQTDETGRTTYYQYDGFNRLSLILDNDLKVLKKFCYNYAGQAEDCGLALFSSVAKSGMFTRNNCGTNGTGSSVTYTVNAGAYTSTISQADADQQATNDVNNNGQAYANAQGSCTWTNQAQSGSFARNNCGTNGTGGSITYTIAAGTYSSMVSLADANQQATNAVNAGGQAYANANAGCTWTNQAQSGSFTRNDCTEGGTGGTVIYTINAGTYSSTVGLADANQQATNAVNAGGQSYANVNASCTWYNATQSGTFTRNNCGAGYTGGSVTYTVAANTYSSTTSQAAADALALADVNTNGQNYANSNGSCTPIPVYVKLVYENTYYDVDLITADLVLKFYSDAACTIPYLVSNLNVNYTGVRSACGGGASTTFNYTAYNCSGTSVVVATGEILMEDDGTHCYEWIFSAAPGTGYTPQ